MKGTIIYKDKDIVLVNNGDFISKVFLKGLSSFSNSYFVGDVISFNEKNFSIEGLEKRENTLTEYNLSNIDNALSIYEENALKDELSSLIYESLFSYLHDLKHHLVYVGNNPLDSETSTLLKKFKIEVKEIKKEDVYNALIEEAGKGNSLILNKERFFNHFNSIISSFLFGLQSIKKLEILKKSSLLVPFSINHLAFLPSINVKIDKASLDKINLYLEEIDSSFSLEEFSKEEIKIKLIKWMKNDKKEVIIAPSILNASKDKLVEVCKELEKSGAAFLHFDVMDAIFVPNLGLSKEDYIKVKPYHNLVNDVHLMVKDVFAYIKDYIELGADIITFHYEALDGDKDLINKAIDLIHKHNVKAGISIKPMTSPECLLPFIDKLDLILVMSVEPGKGGQSFLENSLDKLEFLHKEITKRNLNIYLEVDGGIDDKTSKLVKSRGANVLVAGTYIVNSDNFKEKIDLLKC